MPSLRPHRSALKFCVAASALAGGACTHAAGALDGLGGNVSLQSDSRYRGLSYSDEKPNAQITLSYDGAAGWYGGALLTHARFGQGRQSTLWQGYAGKVFGLTTGLDAEAGVQFNSFDRLGRYDYAEAYVGLLAERWNARLYYANDYFGTAQHTLYAELNGNWPLTASVQAFAHAGVLQGRGGPYAETHSSQRLDWRAGAAWRHEAYELQLAWVGVGRGGTYTWTDSEHRRTWVLGVSASF